jgi:hypothetical protein
MAWMTRAQLKARIAELEAQVAQLQGQTDVLLAKIAELNQLLEQERAADIEEDSEFARQINELTTEVLRLQEIIDSQNPPPDTTGTMFGVTIGGGVRNNMPDLHDEVEISRLYTQGLTNWANDGQHKVFPHGMWAVSNSYSLSLAAFPGFLRSIPDSDKANIHAYADGHELLHPDKGLDAATVKQRFMRTAPIIKDEGLRVAWCGMGWDLRNDDWLNWLDPDLVDVFCWDKYNAGAKKNPPIYQDPAALVGDLVANSKRFGKPWCLWETGTNNFGDQAKRVAWTKALKAEIEKQDGECAVWFDRPGTNNPDWDATLDRATAEAWLL